MRLRTQILITGVMATPALVALVTVIGWVLTVIGCFVACVIIRTLIWFISDGLFEARLAREARLRRREQGTP